MVIETKEKEKFKQAIIVNLEDKEINPKFNPKDSKSNCLNMADTRG